MPNTASSRSFPADWEHLQPDTAPSYAPALHGNTPVTVEDHLEHFSQAYSSLSAEDYADYKYIRNWTCERLIAEVRLAMPDCVLRLNILPSQWDAIKNRLMHSIEIAKNRRTGEYRAAIDHSAVLAIATYLITLRISAAINSATVQ